MALLALKPLFEKRQQLLQAMSVSDGVVGPGLALMSSRRRKLQFLRRKVSAVLRGGTYSCHVWPQSYEHRTSHPYNAGTENFGFLPTRQTLLDQARSAVRCSASRMKGELHPTKSRL